MLRRVGSIIIAVVFLYSCVFSYVFVNFHGYQIIPNTIFGPLLCHRDENMAFNNSGHINNT